MDSIIFNTAPIMPAKDFIYIIFLDKNRALGSAITGFPASITKRVALEMGISLGWERYVGSEGKVLSIETFGASGTGAAVMELFGFTTENVVRTAKSLLQS
jgi:transketolase